jgi:hypothetical protein
MVIPTQRPPAIQAIPGPIAIAAAAFGAMAAWIIALYALQRIIFEAGWTALFVIPLCFFPLLAIWATRWLVSTWRTRAAIPPDLLERRYHGTLDAVTDSEQRPLRPIGMTAGEVAARTELLLDALVTIPSVRIFRGVRAGGVRAEVTTHAVAAGRSLILVESVAWPAGHYRVGGDGRVFCDDVYIGQTVAPLLAAARHWRRALPRWHRVSAMVVVHPVGGVDGVLPTSSRSDLVWTPAGAAVGEIRRRIRARAGISRPTLASLIAAAPAERAF